MFNYQELFVRQLAIIILVSKLKHLLNIFIRNSLWQVLHNMNKIFLNIPESNLVESASLYLAKRMVIDLVFLCSDICGVGVCSTQHLGGEEEDC